MGCQSSRRSSVSSVAPKDSRADQLAGLYPSYQQLAGGGVRIAERELGQRGLVELN